MHQVSQRIPRARLYLAIFSLTILLVVSLSLSLMIGVAGFEPGTKAFSLLVYKIRLPRALMSATVGGLLAISGVYMQTLFRNPLAEPYITGVSAGAGLGAVSAMSLLPLSVFRMPLLIPLSAFIGAMAVSLTLMILARGMHASPLRLLLLGIALGTFCAAILAFILIRFPGRSLKGALFWLFGSVSGASSLQVYIALLTLLIGMIFGILIHRYLDALLLGYDEAASLGVAVSTVNRMLLFFATLLASVAVAFAGIVAFIGLMVPHICRIFFGARHLPLLITSLLLGMSLLTLIDILARQLIAPAEIPLSVITSLVGAPFFILLLFTIRGDRIG